MPSESSIKRYTSVMNGINKAKKDGMKDTPGEVLNFVYTKFPNPNSRRTALSALLYFDDKPEYRKAFDEVRIVADEYQKSQIMTVKKQENFMPWKDVMEVLKKVENAYHEDKETLENLVIISLYTLQPPVRLDYAGMSFDKKDTQSDEGNYAVLTGTKKSFVFNDYKTKNVYGKAIVPINKKLALLLKLFITTISPTLSMSRDSLSKRIISIFKKYSGKEMSVLMLRHSFITDFLSKNISETKKEEMAKMMLHSKNVQAFYNVPSQETQQDENSQDE